MPQYAYYGFKFGYLEIGYENDIVVSLLKKEMVDNVDNKNEFTEFVNNQLTQYLNGERKIFDFPYELRGTSFQKNVWKVLETIPYGETRTYKEVAVLLGNPKAARAVGMANNKNPIIIVVPCHRVIGANGKLVGYGGGLCMKEFLLNIEA